MANVAIVVLLVLSELESNTLHTLATRVTSDALLLYLVVDAIVILRNADARKELKALKQSLTSLVHCEL